MVKRYRVDNEKTHNGNWEVYNCNTDRTVKVCATREKARNYAAMRNDKLSK